MLDAHYQMSKFGVQYIHTEKQNGSRKGAAKKLLLYFLHFARTMRSLLEIWKTTEKGERGTIV